MPIPFADRFTDRFTLGEITGGNTDDRSHTLILRPFDHNGAAACPLALHANLNRDAVFHRLDMADDADGAALALQRLQCIDGQIETFGIK